MTNRTFPCISPSLVFPAPPKNHFSNASSASHGEAFRMGVTRGTESRPSAKSLRAMGMGMLGASDWEEVEEGGRWN